MDLIARQARFTLRTLVRYPFTHGAAVSILALSLGAVLAVLSLTDEILWSPLRGVSEPERVGWLFPVKVGERADMSRDGVSLPNAKFYGENTTTLAAVGWFSGASRVLLDRGEPEELSGFSVSGRLFEALGTQPRLGRLIEPRDIEASASPKVVLSEELWQARFGGSPAAVGSELNLDGVLHEVVGVAPAKLLSMIGGSQRIWLPYRPSPEERASRETSVVALARLAPGATLAQANHDLARLSEEIATAQPQTDAGMSVEAVELPRVLVSFRPLAIALAFASVLVLGVAAANTANLLLAQASQRSREAAIRQALGAGPAQLALQWALQGAVLVALGVAAGTVLAQWTVDGVVASLPESLRSGGVPLMSVKLGARAWLTTVAIAVPTSLLVGLPPARHGLRLDLTRALRDGASGTLGPTRKRWLPGALVALQTTLAAGLTLGGFATYQHFVKGEQIPLGFEPRGLVQLRLPLSAEAGEARRTRLDRLIRTLQDRYDAPAGGGRFASGGVALVDDPPLTSYFEETRFHREGQPKPEPPDMLWGKRLHVGAEYWSVMGIALLAGRTPRPGSAPGGDRPCETVFSQHLADSSFEAGPALGRRIHLDSGETCTIVGVCADVYDVVPGSPGDHYFSIASGPAPGSVALLLRDFSASDIQAVRDLVRSVEPRQVIQQQSVEEVVQRRLWGPRILIVLFGGLAALGLCLAAVGSHAIFAHRASTRRPELGVRAALGAEPKALVLLMARDNLPAGALGASAGMAVCAAGMASAGIHPPPWVFLAAGIVMAIFVVGSVLLSATRAAALSPAEALRH